MVQFFYQVFAALTLVAGSVSPSNQCIIHKGEAFPSHSDADDDFTDEDVERPRTIITSVWIYSGERIDGVGVSADGYIKFHGGVGGTRKTRTYLEEGEKITEMTIHKSGNRIVYLNFTIDDNRKLIEGGHPTTVEEDKITIKPPAFGDYLIDLYGRVAGESIAQLGPFGCPLVCVQAPETHY